MALVEEDVLFTIEQGARFYKKFIWKISGVPVDLTGYKAHLQIRENIEDTEAKFTLSTETLVPPAEGTITLGGAEGTIELDLGASQTALISGWDTGVHDLLIFTDADDGIRLIEGKVRVSPGVTRV